MKIERNANLSLISHWKVGGEVEYLITVDTIAEIFEAISLAKSKSIPLLVVGNTSNILFSSARINAAILKLGDGFKSIDFNGTVLEVGSSAYVPNVVRNCANRGLSGLEHLVGVPATIGGIICMNGGSQRKCVSENIISVMSLDRKGNVITRDALDCDFHYRHSKFQAIDEIILSTKIRLTEKQPSLIRKECMDIFSSRNKKFPRKLPNCGSVFISNPAIYEKLGPPGFLIESCGLKGYKIGGASISDIHANFIVNDGFATSDDILNLIKIAISRVKEKFGVNLNSEIKFVSDAGIFSSCDQYLNITDGFE